MSNRNNFFFERSINFMRDEDYKEQKRKKVMFIVAKDSKHDIGGVLMNSPNVVFTEMESMCLDMEIFAVNHLMIITIVTYGWCAAWLGAHQIESGVMIY